MTDATALRALLARVEAALYEAKLIRETAQ